MEIRGRIARVISKLEKEIPEAIDPLSVKDERKFGHRKRAESWYFIYFSQSLK